MEDYYIYSVDPFSIEENTFSNGNTAKFHIPSLAYNNYYFNTQWSKFPHLEPDNDYQYEYFYLINDLNINNANNNITTTPDVDLNAGSGLIVEATNKTVKLNEVHYAGDATKAASIVANNNLTVEKLYFDIAVTKSKWFFLTFPFRVKLANVTSPGNYVFRYYDGATRAQNGSGGWKNVTTAYLNAGQGYIFQTDTDGTLTLMVEKSNMNFSGSGKQDALSTYSSSSTANASWNFLGNPHTSYFDINKTGYTAPITVWTGSAYKAIRPGDDQYFMKPFEAFFVQKPSSTSAVSFPANGRYTYKQTQELAAAARTAVGAGPVPARNEAGSVPTRALVNLTIAAEDGTTLDQTRVVYNEEETVGYELDCDAAKFFTDGLAAQLYTLDQEGTQYAINERPLGEVPLGYTAATEGELTISAVRMDRPVLLRDNLLGITHDLSLGGYNFQTEAGTNESRFTLTFDGTPTGISEIENRKSVNSQYYDLLGRRVNDARKGGVIVKESNGTSKKVIRK